MENLCCAFSPPVKPDKLTCCYVVEPTNVSSSTRIRTVIEATPMLFEYDGKSAPGMSGLPVVNHEFQLVGIHSAKTTDRNRAYW